MQLLLVGPFLLAARVLDSAPPELTLDPLRGVFGWVKVRLSTTTKSLTLLVSYLFTWRLWVGQGGHDAVDRVEAGAAAPTPISPHISTQLSQNLPKSPHIFPYLSPSPKVSQTLPLPPADSA